MGGERSEMSNTYRGVRTGFDTVSVNRQYIDFTEGCQVANSSLAGKYDDTVLTG